MKNDETLRLDGEGCFHLLKVPEREAAIWNKMIFWVPLYFNKKSHLPAINQAISLFEKRILARVYLMQEDFQEISRQIECLKSLKNDYGFTLDQEYLDEVDRKLKNIEKQVSHLMAAVEEKQRKEDFQYFLHEAKAILTLLEQESVFGLQEARRILFAFSDDVPVLFEARLHNIQARLLLAQDLNAEVEVEVIGSEQQGKFTIPNKQERLNSIKFKLNQEVNNLEFELEVLINSLKNYFQYHSQEINFSEYFILIGSKLLSKESEEVVFTFDPEKPVNEKIEIIQDHLDQLAA